MKALSKASYQTPRTARGRNVPLIPYIGRHLTAIGTHYRNHKQFSTRSLYNFAIARQVPNSFVQSLSSYADVTDPIDLDLAKSQHVTYVAHIRSQVPTLELPPLEDHPDSVFVEDTAVAIGNKVVITWPGHESRQGEVASIANVMHQLGMELYDMKNMSPKALCDGGDVLYTGRHLFVGISSRTNHEGAAVLQHAFQTDKLPVISVPMDEKDALHLKSVITHIDETTLLAPTGDIGDKILYALNPENLGYEVIRLPDIHSCNVVSLNGMVVASETKCKESRTLLEKSAKERNMKLQFVNSSEIAKSDGACTCCSILLSV
mgnify:CR=1 FL=1